MMKYLKFGLAGTAIMVGVFFAGRILWPREGLDTNIVSQKTPTPQGGFAPLTNSEGAVNISVAPKNGLDSGAWKFEITLDTHSVEITEDLSKVSVLVDDSGQEYKPIAWEGDPPGGHHRAVILTFNPLIPKPESIKLKIFEVGGVAERIFAWITTP